MCLAIPHKVIELTENTSGIIEVGRMYQQINLALIPEVRVGDWVLVYCGTATAKVDEDEAGEILRLFEEISQYDPIH